MRPPPAAVTSLVAALLVLLFVGGCATTPPDESVRVISVPPRISLARSILHNPKISLASFHVSGKRDNATALHNIQQTAAGGAARRSYYGRAPGGYTHLEPQMLRAMNILAREGYSFRVTELAGGSHSSTSRHYTGVAFDIDFIDGMKVGYGHPSYRRFLRRCKELGATEVKGPGDRGHSTHVHAAWSRPGQ